MFAITGITGQVGGRVAACLTAAGRRVRAVVRDPSRADRWSRLGATIAVAEMTDAIALRAAFTDVDGVFVLLPPTFDPSPAFDETRAYVDAIRAALAAARPPRVVALSTIGAQAPRTNLLTQLGMLEDALRPLPMPVTFLRPTWFIENVAWDLQAAREDGIYPSFLQPLDRAVPMVSTQDVGRVAAELLMRKDPPAPIVELEGPVRLTAHAIAAALARTVGRDVVATPVARDDWDALLRAQGMRNPGPRIAMLDGFNARWIAFDGEARRGETTIDAVLARLETATASETRSQT